MIALLLVSFVVLSAVWSQAVNPSREKLLEDLRTTKAPRCCC